MIISIKRNKLNIPLLYATSGKYYLKIARISIFSGNNKLFLEYGTKILFQATLLTPCFYINNYLFTNSHKKNLKSITKRPILSLMKTTSPGGVKWLQTQMCTRKKE